MSPSAGGRAAPSLTDALCTRCGLCCDGTLLADVELSGGAEAARVESLGLVIDDDEERPLMVLPCAALRGTRCSVYAHRPRCCRTFECGLLQDARRGAVPVERAVEIIESTKEQVGRVTALLARLGERDAALPLAERVAVVLSAESRGRAASGARAALAAAMAAVERSIRQHFLTSGRRAKTRA